MEISRNSTSCGLTGTVFSSSCFETFCKRFELMIIISMFSLSRGMPDIQWMNLDPVKLMEELSQFTSLEGFKEMLDKAQVGH